MDVSVFLAKVIAIYYIIVSIGLLCNAERYRAVINDLRHNSSLMLISGLIALVIGSLLVVSHNLWVPDWRVLITLIAWSALIKGSLIILCPQFYHGLLSKYTDGKTALCVSLVIVFLFGIFLAYHGFYMAL